MLFQSRWDKHIKNRNHVDWGETSYSYSGGNVMLVVRMVLEH